MTLTKLQKNSILIPLFIVAMAFLLFGCGSRRVDKSKIVTNETTQTGTKTVDSSKTITVTDANTKIIDSSSSEEFSISPIDSTKEMIVEGKKYFNAKLSRKNTSNNKVVDNSAKVFETRQNNIKETVKTKTSKRVEAKVYNSERKNSYWWLLWLLLLIPVYCFYRKYKGMSLV